MERRRLLKSVVAGTGAVVGLGAAYRARDRLGSNDGTGASPATEDGSTATPDGPSTPTERGRDVDDLEYDDAFRKTEWGFVRKTWREPSGSDRPVVYTHDGYLGASFSELGPSHYLELSDGTLVAVSVDRWSQADMEFKFVPVQSSVRGTACSGGSESAFGEVYDRVSHGEDGREVIEWLADRPWSLDRIGLWGVSYSGMTAIRVASTRPPSLACVMANVIMGDILRGRTFPGGVDNLAFDEWLAGLPESWWNHEERGDVVPATDPICEDNYGARDPRRIVDDHPRWYRERTENEGYRRINFVEMAREIEVPTYVSQAWQDGQTGQRGGPAVYDALDPAPFEAGDHPGPPPSNPDLRDSPKLFRATNGVHGTAWRQLGGRDADRWFGYWLEGRDTGILEAAPVQLEFGTNTADSHGAMGMDDFPAPETTWERYYLGADHDLSASPPDPGTETYESSVPDYWFREDLTGDSSLCYRSDPFEEARVIAGTTTATLYVESTRENTELYVSVADLEPDGERATFLQRGMLRASHRELDEERTRYAASRPDRVGDRDVTRPYHTMVEPTPIEPGEVYRLDVEIFPLGHVVYPGHRLLVTVHAPPREEGPGGNRYWSYDPLENGAENTVHYGGDRASRLVVPTLEWGETAAHGRGAPEEGVGYGDLPPEPDCGEPDNYVCRDVELP